MNHHKVSYYALFIVLMVWVYLVNSIVFVLIVHHAVFDPDVHANLAMTAIVACAAIYVVVPILLHRALQALWKKYDPDR